MLFPINQTKIGSTFRICQFGCSSECAQRLRQHGCCEGAKCKVLSKQKQLIVRIGETRLALDKSLANSILGNIED